MHPIFFAHYWKKCKQLPLVSLQFFLMFLLQNLFAIPKSGMDYLTIRTWPWQILTITFAYISMLAICPLNNKFSFHLYPSSSFKCQSAKWKLQLFLQFFKAYFILLFLGLGCLINSWTWCAKITHGFFNSLVPSISILIRWPTSYHSFPI